MKKTPLPTLFVMLCLAVTCLAVSSCSWFEKKPDAGETDYQWSEVKSAGDTVVAVTAIDAEHAWAASLKGDILVSSGRAWESQLKVDGNLTGMCSLGPDRAWVTGHTIYEEGKRVKSFVYSYNGTAWVGEYESEDGMNDVFALDPDHVWVACESGGVLFFNGLTWKRLPGLEDTVCLSVAAASADQVWVGTRDGFIHMYDGTAWRSVYEGSDPVRDIYVFDQNHAWAAVGNTADRKGRIIFYNGKSWSEQYFTSTGAIMAVSGFGPDRVWAVGNRPGAGYALLESNAYFFDGTVWTVQGEIEETLSSVAAVDEQHVWVGGNEGGIYLGQH